MRKQNHRTVSARTPNQKTFIQTVNEKDIIIADCCLGTGKTFLAVGLACEFLNRGKIDKIVMTRTSRHLIKEFGYTTGSWKEKSRDLFFQAEEYFIKFLGEKEFEKHWKDHTIEFTSSSIIRGRSFYRTFIICEEAQEMDMNDWILSLSRLDKESKFLAIGDRWQNSGNEGFFGRLVDNIKDDSVGIVRMTECDVQRNKDIFRVCKKIRAI